MTDQALDQAKKELANLAIPTSNLTNSEKKELLDAVAADLRMPFPRETNILWIIVVATFCFCLALAAVRVSGIIAFFVDIPPHLLLKDNIDQVKEFLPDVDKIMILASSVIGFLAGIFVPSPVRNQPTE